MRTPCGRDLNQLRIATERNGDMRRDFALIAGPIEAGVVRAFGEQQAIRAGSLQAIATTPGFGN